MTNKERLEINNAKIEEIQKTLKNKILALDGKEIEIDLPEEFGVIDTFRHFQVNDDVILFSGSGPVGSDYTNIGLWSYKIKTKSWTQLYNQGYLWQRFQMVGEDCLITSNVTKNLLRYNATSDTIDILTTIDDDFTFHPIGNYCLVASLSYNFVYDLTTKTLEQMPIPTSYGITQHIIIGNKCLISSSTASKGLYLFDSSNKTTTEIYNEGRGWIYTHLIGDKCLISSDYNESVSYGILLLNMTDNSVEKIYNEGYAWSLAQNIGDKILISSTKTVDLGLLMYSLTTNTIKKIYEEGYSWRDFIPIGNECLFTSGVTALQGLWVYNSEDDSVKKIYETGNNWCKHYKIINNKCLMSASTSTTKGILLYNATSKTVDLIYSTGYNYDYLHIVDDKCLISSSSQPGILVYDYEADAIEKKYSSYSRWEYKQNVPIGCLIGGLGAKGLLVYNKNEGTITLIYKEGTTYDTFTPDGDNWIVESSDKTASKITIYYDSINNTAKAIKYSLEVE